MEEWRLFDVEFMTNGTFNYIMEKVLQFDDWSESYPMINAATVKFPEELTLEFYYEPKELRNKPYKLIGDYIHPGRPQSAQYLRSFLENSHDHATRHLTGLDVAGKELALYVSVQEMLGPVEDLPDLVDLGHHHYSFYNESRALYRTKLHEPWQQAW